jgi:hypothetical protein
LAGESIEERLMPIFEAGWGKVRAEEDIPIKWQLPSGRSVTGRPDFVLMNDDDTPHTGIELKTIVSSSSMSRVWYDQKPDIKHLIQAAHYSWKLDAPWILMYVSCTVYPNSCLFKDVRTAHDIPYRGKTQPFIGNFYLEWRGDELYYNYEGGESVKTIITKSGIQQYYELVDECIANKQLYYTPASVYADGSQMPYLHERYCEYCQAATEASGDFEHWKDILYHKQQGETTE